MLIKLHIACAEIQKWIGSRTNIK